MGGVVEHMGHKMFGNVSMAFAGGVDLSKSACLPSIINNLSMSEREEGSCEARRNCNAFTGVIIAAFPFAQILFAPSIGHFGSRTVRPILSLTLAIMAVGYVIYSLARGRWALLIARFIIGVGAGNISVLRFYAAAATSEEQRTGMMAKMSGAQVHVL